MPLASISGCVGTNQFQGGILCYPSNLPTLKVNHPWILMKHFVQQISRCVAFKLGKISEWLENMYPDIIV